MRCKHCGNVFTPNGSDFCSAKHRKMYSEERAVCMYPDKKWFWHPDDAWDYIDSHDDLVKPNLRPFDCTCGRLHLGHGKPTQYSRTSA